MLDLDPSHEKLSDLVSVDRFEDQQVALLGLQVMVLMHLHRSMLSSVQALEGQVVWP